MPTLKGLKKFQQQWGGGMKRKHSTTGEELDQNNLYTPFSRSAAEWLSSNQILKSTIYLRHTHYQQAKHQNMHGITHTTAKLPEFLLKLRQAASSDDLEDSICIGQTVRDTLDANGPCPAITFGDNAHFRNVLIDSRRKSVSLIDPFGYGFSTNVKNSIINLYSRDTTGDWSFIEWKVKLQHDGYNCGIWAI